MARSFATGKRPMTCTEYNQFAQATRTVTSRMTRGDFFPVAEHLESWYVRPGWRNR